MSPAPARSIWSWARARPALSGCQSASDPLEPAPSLGQIATALDLLHKNGIVHRDLKPQNVAWSPRQGRRRVKLADFGISLLLEGAGRGRRRGPALAEQVDLAALQSATGAANTEPGPLPRQGQVATTLDSSISSEFAANGRSRSEEGRRRTGPGTDSAGRASRGGGEPASADPDTCGC